MFIDIMHLSPKLLLTKANTTLLKTMHVNIHSLIPCLSCFSTCAHVYNNSASPLAIDLTIATFVPWDIPSILCYLHATPYIYCKTSTFLVLLPFKEETKKIFRLYLKDRTKCLELSHLSSAKQCQCSEPKFGFS